jgi:hypothetical protein
LFIQLSGRKNKKTIGKCLKKFVNACRPSYEDLKPTKLTKIDAFEKPAN